MSFILEALKRADRERRLERAPDLSAVYEDNDLPGHNGIRPWLWLCGAFLVGVIVVGLVLWPAGPGVPIFIGSRNHQKRKNAPPLHLCQCE
ncbi:MAG: hypothetical protein JRF52_12485 [Deltaproteobacteria bacterium]|nr:hypothetical protein [Deltaproteobacteria bacterium]